MISVDGSKRHNIGTRQKMEDRKQLCALVSTLDSMDKTEMT